MCKCHVRRERSRKLSIFLMIFKMFMNQEKERGQSRFSITSKNEVVLSCAVGVVYFVPTREDEG